MKGSLTGTKPKQLFNRTIMQIAQRCSLIIAAALLAATAPAIAQNGDLQLKLAEVKQAAALNQQALHQYQWTETTQLTLKGDPKPASQKLCQYGPDGQIQKTPIGPPPEQPSGGRLKQRVVQEKRRDDGLHGRCKGSSRDVCPA